MGAFAHTLAATLVLASAVSAQYNIDPNSVSNYTRQAWCTDQQTQCPLICLQYPGTTGTTEANDCDPDALQYSCICSNGISPNVSEYSQTLPYFICQTWGTQCVANCGLGNSACAAACQQDHPCGALNPTLQNTSTLTGTAASQTTSGTTTASTTDAAATTDTDGQTVYSGFAGQTSTSSDSNAANTANAGDTGAASTIVRVWALSTGQTFGSIALFGGMCLGFAVLL